MVGSDPISPSASSPLGRTGHTVADEMAHLLNDELAVAKQLLHRLLDYHTEAVRDLEAITDRLLEIPWTTTGDHNAVRSKRISELLTVQQMAVLEQICLGRTNRQIAKKLGITEKTTKNYTQAVFRKLRVHSRTEAALVAIRCGWFETEPLSHRERGIPRQRDGESSSLSSNRCEEAGMRLGRQSPLGSRFPDQVST